MERAASYFRDGETIGIESVSQVVAEDFAYTVEIERYRAKIARSKDRAEVALRVTCVYRREDGRWKLMHRHADPRVARQTPESVIRE